jgi:peptidoglycan/xylan/chitin deacetylase (PgdA/CDA1 family)
MLGLLLGAAGLLLAAGADSTGRATAAELPDLSDHAVVLMFDDGWHSVFTNAFPLLKEHGMKVVLPLISNSVAGGKVRYSGHADGYMNRAEVQEMIDALGAEVVSHTKSHPFLTRLSDAEATEELTGSRQALERMFHQPVTVFVYPYGDYDARIRDLVAEAGYALARSIRPGTLSFASRPYDLPSTEIRRTTSVEYVKTRIASTRHLILFFHRIVANPSSYTEWSTGRFAELLDWLDAANVQVMTTRELYQYCLGVPLGPGVARRGWRNRIEWDLLEKIDVNFTAAAQ